MHPDNKNMLRARRVCPPISVQTYTQPRQAGLLNNHRVPVL